MLAGDLQAYFRSGWAFLIPYLAVYLVYAWAKWPVNPEVAFRAHAPGWMPCLLHVYWVMHLLHLVLGAVALRHWWRAGPGAARQPGIVFGAIFPWVALAAFFHLPGLYLEFPADPWEHLSRITQWRDVAEVTAAASWTKASYFLAYTLSCFSRDLPGHMPALEACYTAGCLLLSWQYFRLGRAVGLSTGAAGVFVLLQALLMGNNVFSFHRYYGLSSTLYAHIGYIAVLRLAVSHLHFGISPASSAQGSHARLGLRAAVAAGFACLLIAGNHTQGLGMAALGMTGVLGGRLWASRPALRIWLAAAVVVLSAAAVIWSTQALSLDRQRALRPWLSPWQGFSLWNPSSPAGFHAMAILGWAGVLNLLAGFWLLRHNHIAGWITVFPPLALLTPLGALPLALLLQNGDQPLLLFNRMLLAIPAGLALVAAFSAFRPFNLREPGFAWLLLGLGLFTVVPAAHPGGNRLFHCLVRPPDDLVLQPATQTAPAIRNAQARWFGGNARVAAQPGPGYVLNAHGVLHITHPYRSIRASAATRAERTDVALRTMARDEIPALAYLPDPRTLYTPGSTLGLLSRHWLPHEVTLDFAAVPELLGTTSALGYRPVNPAHPALMVWFPPGHPQRNAAGKPQAPGF